jgi:hypothetical protein
MVWVKVFPSRRGEGIDRWRKIGGGRISLWAFDGGSFLLRVFGKFGSSKVTHISFFWLTGGKSVRLWDKGSRSLGVFPSGNQQRPKWAKTGALNASKICEHRCGFVEENLQGKHRIKLLHSSAFPQDIFGNGETIFEGKEGHSGRPLAEALRHGRNRVNPQ